MRIVAKRRKTRVVDGDFATGKPELRLHVVADPLAEKDPDTLPMCLTEDLGQIEEPDGINGVENKRDQSQQRAEALAKGRVEGLRKAFLDGRRGARIGQRHGVLNDAA